MIPNKYMWCCFSACLFVLLRFAFCFFAFMFRVFSFAGDPVTRIVVETKKATGKKQITTARGPKQCGV